MNAIQTLLGSTPLETFVREHYLKQPFSLPFNGKELTNLATPETIGAILAQPEVDLLLVRDGVLWNGPPPRGLEEARDLVGRGYTVLIRHSERHDSALAEYGRSFARSFLGEINVHIYWTPPGHHSFGWHYDVEEVFILQTTGEKDYFLRPNTVCPSPLLETMPRDLQYERETSAHYVNCKLIPGDWIYIPAGFWHVAKASREAISISLGVMATRAVELFDHVRRQLLSSPLWLQRLPPAGDLAEIAGAEERYREVLATLAGDLAARLLDPKTLSSFFADKKGRNL